LDVENSEDYMNSLNRSLYLAMDEFYGYCTSIDLSHPLSSPIVPYLPYYPYDSTIKATGVSAATGEGIEGLFEHIDDAAVEFRNIYLPDLMRYRAAG